MNSGDLSRISLQTPARTRDIVRTAGERITRGLGVFTDGVGMLRDEESAGAEREESWPWWREPEIVSSFRSKPGIEGEARTRELLAREVYRVPDAWLDEVVRVRMADLRKD